MSISPFSSYLKKWIPVLCFSVIFVSILPNKISLSIFFYVVFKCLYSQIYKMLNVYESFSSFFSFDMESADTSRTCIILCTSPRKISKLNEPGTQDSVGGAGTSSYVMYFYGPPHMAELIQEKAKDLPVAMNDREKWRERVRDIRAGGMTWWWWWMVQGV